MPTATISFNLEDQDDELAFNRFVKSTDMAMVLWELMNNTKKKVEYEMESQKLDGYDTLDLVFEKILELMEERNINLSELIV